LRKVRSECRRWSERRSRRQPFVVGQKGKKGWSGNEIDHVGPLRKQSQIGVEGLTLTHADKRIKEGRGVSGHTPPPFFTSFNFTLTDPTDQSAITINTSQGARSRTFIHPFFYSWHISNNTYIKTT
jgi:hypothetical protein